MMHKVLMALAIVVVIEFTAATAQPAHAQQGWIVKAVKSIEKCRKTKKC